MKIYNSNNGPFNFEEILRPLFEAMRQGKVIKSVTCCAGLINKNDRTKDFILCDFIATDYYVAMMSTHDNSEKFDLVDTNLEDTGEGKSQNSFYMSWVISFELY